MPLFARPNPQDEWLEGVVEEYQALDTGETGAIHDVFAIVCAPRAALQTLAPSPDLNNVFPQTLDPASLERTVATSTAKTVNEAGAEDIMAGKHILFLLLSCAPFVTIAGCCRHTPGVHVYLDCAFIFEFPAWRGAPQRATEPIHTQVRALL